MRHLLAPEADLPETADLPAGGPGAVGAVDRRVQVATPLLPFSLGGPEACRVLFLPQSTEFFSKPANPGSDWKALKALALVALRLWPAPAGSLNRS